MVVDKLWESVIQLREDDPIVINAINLETNALTEVGLIPGDACGCKIYGRNKDGRLLLIGEHSRSYGCKEKPLTLGVEIIPSIPKT
jgi:hypothetical protein